MGYSAVPPWWELSYPDGICIRTEPNGVRFRVEVHVAYCTTTTFDLALTEKFLCHRIEADEVVRLDTCFHDPDTVRVIYGHAVGA